MDDIAKLTDRLLERGAYLDQRGNLGRTEDGTLMSVAAGEIGRLHDRIHDLEEYIKVLEAENGGFKRRLAALEGQLAPHPKDYEWRQVSDFIKTSPAGGVWLEVPWDDGWELVGGALRRPRKEKEA